MLSTLALLALGCTDPDPKLIAWAPTPGCSAAEISVAGHRLWLRDPDGRLGTYARGRTLVTELRGRQTRGLRATDDGVFAVVGTNLYRDGESVGAVDLHPNGPVEIEVDLTRECVLLSSNGRCELRELQKLDRRWGRRCLERNQIGPGVVISSDLEGNVDAYGLADGAQLWSRVFPSPLPSVSIVGRNIVVVYVGGVWVGDLTTGRLKWARAAEVVRPLAKNRLALAGPEALSIVAVATGTTTSSSSFPAGHRSSHWRSSPDGLRWYFAPISEADDQRESVSAFKLETGDLVPMWSTSERRAKSDGLHSWYIVAVSPTIVVGAADMCGRTMALRGIHPESGEHLWQRTLRMPYERELLEDRYLAFRDSGGAVTVVDAWTGSIEGRLCDARPESSQ